MVNATGWSELLNASPVQAAYTMYNTAFTGWSLVFLFFTFKSMLYLKTRSLVINFVCTMLFLSLFYELNILQISTAPLYLIVAVAVFEGVGALYQVLVE